MIAFWALKYAAIKSSLKTEPECVLGILLYFVTTLKLYIVRSLLECIHYSIRNEDRNGYTSKIHCKTRLINIWCLPDTKSAHLLPLNMCEWENSKNLKINVEPSFVFEFIWVVMTGTDILLIFKCVCFLGYCYTNKKCIGGILLISFVQQSSLQTA